MMSDSEKPQSLPVDSLTMRDVQMMAANQYRKFEREYRYALDAYEAIDTDPSIYLNVPDPLSLKYAASIRASFAFKAMDDLKQNFSLTSGGNDNEYLLGKEYPYNPHTHSVMLPVGINTIEPDTAVFVSHTQVSREVSGTQEVLLKPIFQVSEYTISIQVDEGDELTPDMLAPLVKSSREVIAYETDREE